MEAPIRKTILGGAVRRPVMLFVTLVALLVISVIAYSRIPVAMIPEGIQDNGLQVFISNPGASAHENERKVVRVLEEQIRTLSGIRDVYSSSREDRASIEVIYERETDIDLAKAELRDRIERARTQLPDTVDRIMVWSWNQSELPLMWLAVLHPGDSDRTDYLVDTVVQRRLEAIDGVSKVEIFGMLDDSVRILLDEEKVRAANLDIGALIRRLSADNFAKPLGEVQDGGQRVLVRSDMRFKTIEEIESFPIGKGQTIADVGTVERVKTVRDRLSRINGQYAYFGQIGRENTANVVETARRVQKTLDELSADPQLEGELQFLVLFSQGDFIEASLGQLRSTALWGGALAAIVLLVFLRRIRVTLCVALSIPISSMLALAWVYFTGGTFNVLTMTGITLAIGMLVDNSVVVIENIARLNSEGRSPIKAAAEGVSEVGLAVSLATMTTVVVFLPLIFMSGNPVIRIMFGALGLPLCISLLFSLLVALVFLPAVAARIVGPRQRAVERVAAGIAPIAQAPVRAAILLLNVGKRGLFFAAVLAHRVERGLLAVIVPLRWGLAPALLGFAIWKSMQLMSAGHRLAPLAEPGMAPPMAGAAPMEIAATWIAAGLVAALLVVLGTPVWRRRAQRPPVLAISEKPRSQSRITSFVDLAILSNSRLLAWSMDHRLMASFLAAGAFLSVIIPQSNMTVAAFGEDESRGRIDVSIGLEDNFTLREASEEMALYETLLEGHRGELGFDHLSVRFDNDGGRLSLFFEEAQAPGEMKITRQRLKDIWPDIPGHETRFYGDESIDTRNRSMVAFQILGPDPDTLARLGQLAVEKLGSIPGLGSISTPLQDAPRQVHVEMDTEKSWQLGVTADIALQNIAWVLRGFSLPRFHEPGRELPFIIEYDEEEVAGLSTLRDLSVFSGTGPVSLASFARLEFEQGPRAIYRHNGQVSFTIQGQVDDPNQQRAVSDAGYAALRELDLPRGFSLGDEQSIAHREDQEMQEMKSALLFSIVLVFLLMAILFESLIKPFAVLFTIPFAVVGALWTLYLTGTVMDSVGWIGIIILVGVVVNNGIVLIDRIDRLHVSGISRRDAVLQGGASRVRPILMTAITTIFGLLPMVFAEPPSEGIDYRALATCVAGGLAFSTFFTLWVVPLAYTVVIDTSEALQSRLRFSIGKILRGRQGAQLEEKPSSPPLA